VSHTVRRALSVGLLLTLALAATPSATLAQVDSEGRPHESLTLQQVRAQIDLMLLHLNEAIFALSGNDLRIARSQFKQFFAEWDRAEEELQQLYPERYDQLDTELERAEIALLHTWPEDIDTARFALRALRSGLLEIVHDLEARLDSDESP
jgi:hypothetical protein